MGSVNSALRMGLHWMGLVFVPRFASLDSSYKLHVLNDFVILREKKLSCN